MIHNLSLIDSVIHEYLLELRDEQIQKDSFRFRLNLERVGEMMAYEISKTLEWEEVEVTTPLGIAQCRKLKQQPVLATILRAGIPMHQGLLRVFDKAENAFIAGYRKHDKEGGFDIFLPYVTSPSLEGKVLILCDPMLATGASIERTIREITVLQTPTQIHIVSAIASNDGVEYLKRRMPHLHIWAGAIDEELTAKSYIVPGLGDAGDLAFGEKMQE